jgi:hypothetical protein
MRRINLFLSLLLVWMWLAGCGAEEMGLAAQVEELMGDDDGVYVVVTLAETLDEATVGRLAAAGIALFDPLGGSRYEAYIPATAVSALTALHQDNIITSVASIDPATKIKGAFPDPQESYAIIVHFYVAPTEAETAVLATHMRVERTAVGVMNFVEGWAAGADIPSISQQPFVKGIEETVRSTGGAVP